MQRRSPPRHRHDGTSPLPLGMDWSPAPRKWSGRDTVWPHDPSTGWSYCVSIPSWVILPKSRDSDPVVFYRVQVAIQSPNGMTTTRGILRRFNDFLKLFSDVKKDFPKKTIPPAPSKGLLRMKSRVLLEERRCSLEEWMAKLLSDIDISRSFSVATFLELEAAARSSCQDEENQQTSGTNPATDNTASSLQSPLDSTFSGVAGSSIASDYGSDTAYETSEIGTPRVERDENLEFAVDDLRLGEDLTSPIEKLLMSGMYDIDEGLFMGQTILEQLEGLPRHKMHPGHISGHLRETNNGNASRASILVNNGLKVLPPEHGDIIGHARKISTESAGSDGSSVRGSEISNNGTFPRTSANGSFDLSGGGNEVAGDCGLQFSSNMQILLPLDQRPKMNRVFLTMQRRLVTARTDMEDLIARLNQEIAVKEYLASKVNDMEVELESTKQKAKENLQQAVLLEREMVTHLQWEMEELRQKTLEMELKLNSEETKKECTLPEESLEKELGSTKEQLHKLAGKYDDLEARSKAEIKVLVKEVKSLRRTQEELKQELSQSLKEKAKAESLLRDEKERRKQANGARKKLLRESKTLHKRLLECNVDFLPEKGGFVAVDTSSLEDAVNLLTATDDRISLLLSEAKAFSEDEQPTLSIDGDSIDPDSESRKIDAELRKVLAEVIVENSRLRKQVLSVIRHAIEKCVVPDNDVEGESTSQDVKENESREH